MIVRYKLIVLLTLSSLLAVGCWRTTTEPTGSVAPYLTPLQVGPQQIFVDVVDNDLSRSRGLSGRERLLNSQGMLFDFRNTNITRPEFWMKDMRFALDFIWIKDSAVIGITPNAPVEAKTSDEDLSIYRPPGDIDAVLEVNAGWASDHHIKVGDQIKF